MSIDLLIARLETNPEEFFDENRVVFDYDTNVQKKAPPRWAPIVQCILSKEQSWVNMFTDAERSKLQTALNVAMRKTVDAKIMRALLTGEPPPRPGSAAKAEVQYSTDAKLRALKGQYTTDADTQYLEQQRWLEQQRLARNVGMGMGGYGTTIDQEKWLKGKF